MHIEYRFLSIAEYKKYNPDFEVDSDHLFESGVKLYGTAILSNPYGQDNDFAVCLAIADGKIVGRFILFRTKLKVGKEIIPIQTGGGILLSEKYRGLGLGTSLIQKVLENDIHLGALYTRAAYNIVRKTEVMLEIPQYVKLRYYGIKKVLDIPIFIKYIFLKSRFTIKKLTIVPQWAGDMIAADNSKYMEVHDVSWLQWSLDNTATGVMEDYQSFYAIYDRNNLPIGFFITKVRTIEQDGVIFKKANLVEWASSKNDILDEVDINILAFYTLDDSICKFWTISGSKKIGDVLKRFMFKRRGWFAISIRKDKRFKDIGDISQWRIRYGCCNTALVE